MDSALKAGLWGLLAGGGLHAQFHGGLVHGCRIARTTLTLSGGKCQRYAVSKINNVFRFRFWRSVAPGAPIPTTRAEPATRLPLPVIGSRRGRKVGRNACPPTMTLVPTPVTAPAATMAALPATRSPVPITPVMTMPDPDRAEACAASVPVPVDSEVPAEAS